MTNVGDIHRQLTAAAERLDEASPTIDTLRETLIAGRATNMAPIAAAVEKLRRHLPLTIILCEMTGWSVAGAADTASEMVTETMTGSAREEVPAALGAIATMRQKAGDAYDGYEAAGTKEEEIAATIELLAKQIGEHTALLAGADSAAVDATTAQQAAIGHIHALQSVVSRLNYEWPGSGTV